jgi:hypothetical protein
LRRIGLGQPEPVHADLVPGVESPHDFDERLNSGEINSKRRKLRH